MASLPLGRSFKAGPAHDGPPRARSGRCARATGPRQARTRRAANGDARRTAQGPTGGDGPAAVAGAALPAIPVDWHRSTMAHLCAMYPFHADRGFGEAGVYFGINVTAGLDGFYSTRSSSTTPGCIENPNMMVTGTIGSAKSGTVKAMHEADPGPCTRTGSSPCWTPRASTRALAEWLGIPVVKLQPGRPSTS